MRTKLQQFEIQPNIPAGIIEGTEAFWHAGREERWVIHQGTAMKYTDAPIKVQNMIAMAFLKDKKSRAFLKKKGVTAFSKGFDIWYRCVIGGLDNVPDFVDGKLIPDGYNNTCTDMDCPDRGKFCSLKTGLKYYEVATISALKGGFTFEQTAELLCISLPGLKSRVEKIKEKLGARNMASLMSRAAEIGI